jgi:hypothetical protein
VLAILPAAPVASPRSREKKDYFRPIVLLGFASKPATHEKGIMTQ